MNWFRLGFRKAGNSRKMRSWNKVFEVGLPRTGTTSLGKAYEILGFRHKGWDIDTTTRYKSGDIDFLLKLAEQYDAFEDHPWHAGELFKTLDARFPDSKFIFLDRDLDGWLKSFERHFSAATRKKRIPGTHVVEDFEAEKARIIKWYHWRQDSVREYFQERDSDFLIMSIVGGDGWQKLCPFLEVDIPGVPFPHENKSKSSSRAPRP